MNLQSTRTQCALGFIGAGKLAGSVIRGLLLNNFCPPDQIIASQPIDDLRAELQAETGIRVTTSNAEVVAAADTILIGVKPTVVLPVIKETAPAIRDKLVISLAAGIRLSSMEELADARFLRVMTNTPSAIGRGASALAPGARSTAEDIACAAGIFGAIGVVVRLTDGEIDAVTALAGSGPAFVYSVIEALAAGGVKTGLPGDVALRLATQTVLGASQLAAESGSSPEELRRMVITPGGTTAAGLAAMETHRTAEGLIAAVEAAADRGREMAQPSAS
ncbi:MAG: pyrroline-5-carboxylate reductase [Chthoniobacterales bacterium]|nr:pyrroline-5-carboxylate reductase [Chthoniobacterales bacterium]